MTKKRILSEEEKTECANLKAIYLDKRKELGLTHEVVGEALGGISQGAVSHILNGLNPISLKAAIVFSRLLHVPISEFSERLAMQAELPSNFYESPHLNKLVEAVDGLSDKDVIELIGIAQMKKKLSGAA